MITGDRFPASLACGRASGLGTLTTCEGALQRRHGDGFTNGHPRGHWLCFVPSMWSKKDAKRPENMFSYISKSTATISSALRGLGWTSRSWITGLYGMLDTPAWCSWGGLVETHTKWYYKYISPGRLWKGKDHCSLCLASVPTQCYWLRKLLIYDTEGIDRVLEGSFYVTNRDMKEFFF